MNAPAAAPAPEEKGDLSDLSSPAKDNLQALARMFEHEKGKISGMQLVIERVSAFFGSPTYLFSAVSFIGLWVLVNTWGAFAGWKHVDAPPFFWLQGIVSSNALILTVAVLIRQNRMAQLADYRAHLDLQINLLTEQKATKTLQLVDELRRQLPALRGESDAEVQELSKPADARAILKEIRRLDDER